MKRKYGNMGVSMRQLSEASGVNENTIMRLVRLLEPFSEGLYVEKGGKKHEV